KGGNKNSSTSATSGGEESTESSGGSSQASTSSRAKAGSSSGGASSGSNKGGAAGASTKKSGTGGTSQGQGGATKGGSSQGGSTTVAATGGAQNVSVPRLSNGQDGWASRYWDCCKPSCGWTGNANGKPPVTSCDKDNNKISDPDAKSACNGGPAYECWDLAPWTVGPNLAYGYAAFNGVPCGTCMQLDFTGGTHNGNAASTGALSSKTMIVQVINIGGIGGGQFDLLIPGGGVGDFNACSTQWGSSDLGAQYGGFMLGCNGDKGCVQNKCNTVFANKPLLKAGCDWFLGWFNGADNPTLKYAQLATCPDAITAKSGMK
ncbi:MAG TPA: hypothetical protein VKP30_30870, partial [Polyangiaceae bacterium]|nr:hypothetical protein [Polyangiaceae bacterium]